MASALVVPAGPSRSELLADAADWKDPVFIRREHIESAGKENRRRERHVVEEILRRFRAHTAGFVNLRRRNRFRERQIGILHHHTPHERNEQHAEHAAYEHEGCRFPVGDTGRKIEPRMRDDESGNCEDCARRHRFTDRTRRARDVLFKDRAFEDTQHGHADHGRRIRGCDGLARAQSEIGVGRAENHTHHEPEQHRPERELLHLHVRRNERFMLPDFRLRRHASLAFTFSLTSFPSTVFPASAVCTAFITSPICFAEVAPVSAIAASIAASSSASLAAAGR